MQDDFAIATLERWIEANRHKFEKFELRVELPAVRDRGLHVQIDTPRFGASLSAWDQGNAVELHIVDFATGDSTIDDGPCRSEKELLDRLNAFLKWFEQNYP